MNDYLHELAHNKIERGYSTPAWTARFNEAINNMLQPAEQSDDPWGEVIVPEGVEYNVHHSTQVDEF
jgi:hypothetical protein